VALVSVPPHKFIRPPCFYTDCKKLNTWMTIKETSGRKQWWGRNGSFIGLTWWPEAEEEKDLDY